MSRTLPLPTLVHARARLYSEPVLPFQLSPIDAAIISLTTTPKTTKHSRDWEGMRRAAARIKAVTESTK